MGHPQARAAMRGRWRISMKREVDMRNHTMYRKRAKDVHCSTRDRSTTLVCGLSLCASACTNTTQSFEHLEHGIITTKTDTLTIESAEDGFKIRQEQ